jgi:murein DD-endopeptidase MepM/ murein hydrolase activator NlpD
MGTLLVVEHHRAAKELVNAVYMHGGLQVFVEAGEKVTAGQLLGTQGLSFSIENGGHFAHLHLGLYPGPFSLTHNYGYKPASAGLDDWLDPAKVLPEWIAANPPAPAKR